MTCKANFGPKILSLKTKYFLLKVQPSNRPWTVSFKHGTCEARKKSYFDDAGDEKYRDFGCTEGKRLCESSISFGELLHLVGLGICLLRLKCEIFFGPLKTGTSWFWACFRHSWQGGWELIVLCCYFCSMSRVHTFRQIYRNQVSASEIQKSKPTLYWNVWVAYFKAVLSAPGLAFCWGHLFWLY